MADDLDDRIRAIETRLSERIEPRVLKLESLVTWGKGVGSGLLLLGGFALWVWSQIKELVFK